LVKTIEFNAETDGERRTARLPTKVTKERVLASE
jgi:hypothetical protein